MRRTTSHPFPIVMCPAKMEGATGDTFLMRPTVGKIVAAKASYFNKEQQLSTSDAQQVQYQSLGNNKSQQGSIGVRIWFWTRGSEVQILSPRPIFSMT